MKKPSPYRAKIHQWFGIWWRIALKDTRAPLFDTSARLQFFSFVALLIFVLPPEGYAKWTEELTNTMRALQALVYALPLFLCLNAVVAIFKAAKEQRRLGQWADNRFVYHQRRHLMTAVVTAEDNGRLLPFKVTGLPKNASVDLIVEIEKGFDDRNVRVQIVGSKDHPVVWDQYERRNMLAFVPEDETFYVTTLKHSPSNDSTVKVFLMSWYA
jgi:hypothetical protein